MTASWVRAGQGGGGIEQKGKRTHGHGKQCGDCQHEGGIRGLNGNGKNAINIKLKKKKEHKSNSQEQSLEGCCQRLGHGK